MTAHPLASASTGRVPGCAAEEMPGGTWGRDMARGDLV